MLSYKCIHRARPLAARLFAGLPAVMGLIVLATGQAHAQHVDILLSQDGSGKINTGDENSESASVFGSRTEFEVAFTDDPGFVGMAPGDARIPAGFTSLMEGVGATDTTELTFNARAFDLAGGSNFSDLWFWDGTSEVSFAPATQHSVEISKGPFAITINGSSANTPGLTFGSTTGQNEIHDHLDFDIDENGNARPDAGLWAFALDLSVDGLQTSDPFLVVLIHELNKDDTAPFGSNGNAILESAVTSLQNGVGSTTFAPVPEPSTVILALLGCLGLCTWRWRRKRK